MANNIFPSSPPPPPIQGNISTLVSPDILANLGTSQQPEAFGEQLLKTGLAAGTNTALNSTIARLYKEKADLITEGTQLDITHKSTLLKYGNQYNIDRKQAGSDTQKLSKIEKEYEEKVAFETISYEKAKKNLQERKDKNQKDIDDFLKDPFAEQKKKRKERQERIKKLKAKTKKEKQDARKQRRKAVLQNAKKTIVPILTLLLTDKIAEIISQNDTIKKLVDDTNAIIEDANISNDPTKLNNAKIARDNAIRVIQSNEDKINKINEQIRRITFYITIFSTIISILSSIAIPTSVPPGVGIPLTVITKIVTLLEKANKIVLALSALLPIILVSLQKAIQILQDYKAQLLEIKGRLDNKILSSINEGGGGGLGPLGQIPPSQPLISNPFTDILPKDINFGTSGYGSYKGFKFALREENDPKFIVRGNKRHYAVAINSNNVEVLKSEFSFTLDPNDLIEQLKLVIDRENLIG